MSQWFHEPAQSLLDIKAHWARVHPREAVGVITDDNRVVPLPNMARRTHEFRVGFWSVLFRFGWAGLRYGKGIRMIYHTHESTSQPSQTDLAFMVEVSRIWPHVNHLIVVPDREWSVWEGTKVWPEA